MYKPTHLRRPTLKELSRDAGKQTFRLFGSFLALFVLILISYQKFGPGPEIRYVEKPPTAESSMAATDEATVNRWSSTYNCSSSGFADGVVPERAIVYSEEEGPQLTSFEEGWEAYTSDSSDELYAVCKN